VACVIINWFGALAAQLLFNSEFVGSICAAHDTSVKSWYSDFLPQGMLTGCVGLSPKVTLLPQLCSVIGHQS
jgi:hypothetical protein